MASGEDSGFKLGFKGLPNLYQLLGVSVNASSEEIRRSHLAKARLYHPDKNPHSLPEENDMMKYLYNARDILSDPEKRIKHDEHLTDDLDTTTPSDLM